MLKHFNKELIQESDILLIAVSGGIDSMVMLHYLNNIKANHKIKIAVVHFDHQKRKDSSLDCELVKNTCKKLSIECFTDTLNIQEINDNFHDYARTKRYDFFVKIAKKINANKIVLAHNSNDLTETILMRLTRGTSFEGYRGILPEAEYKEMKIIRPLLTVSRKEIEAYQKENKIPFNEDSSNKEDDYTRNRYRHHILPFLENENPRYLDKFQQFSEYQTKAYQLIDKHANDFIKSHILKEKDRYVIYVDKFLSLEEIVQIDVIKKLTNKQTDNQVELNFQNIKDIIKMFSNKKPHLEFTLEGSLGIYKSYNEIYISTQKPISKNYELIINDFGEYSLPNKDLVIITKNPNKYYGFMFKLCYNNLDFSFPIIIRNRRNGDKVKTTSGTKKVKDIFINKKIPLSKRNELPLFFNKQGDIIWIPGAFKENHNSDHCIYLIYQEGNHA